MKEAEPSEGAWPRRVIEEHAQDIFASVGVWNNSNDWLVWLSLLWCDPQTDVTGVCEHSCSVSPDLRTPLGCFSHTDVVLQVALCFSPVAVSTGWTFPAVNDWFQEWPQEALVVVHIQVRRTSGETVHLHQQVLSLRSSTGLSWLDRAQLLLPDSSANAWSHEEHN